MKPRSRKKLSVFLRHSTEDKARVRDLYNKLLNDGVDPWLDQEKLVGGTDWSLEINKAIRGAHAVIVCLSKASITKSGFVQKEIKRALDVADEQPEGAIFLIPLRLEDCDLPDRLRDKQQIDFFAPQGYHRLLRALKQCADALGIKLVAGSEIEDRETALADLKQISALERLDKKISEAEERIARLIADPAPYLQKADMIDNWKTKLHELQEERRQFNVA
jgi:hypothetical protein